MIAAIAALSMAPSVADAQQYYMRKTMAGAKVEGPTHTYQAVYNGFGACSGGSQTATLKSCTREDGVVDNTQCAPTKAQSCTMPQGVCGSFQDKKWVNNTSGEWGRTDIAAASNADLLTKAATFCQGFAQAGFCQVSYAYGGSTSSGNVRYYKTGSARIEAEGGNGYHFHSTSCTAS